MIHRSMQKLLDRYLTYFSHEAARTMALADFLRTTRKPLTARFNMGGHLTASAFIINPAADATLLIHHKRLDRWLQPGGHIEANETPEQAAAREATEELGLSPEAVTHLHLHPWHARHAIPIDIDSHPIPANPRKEEEAHTHHDLLYLFLLDPHTPLSPEWTEVRGAKWFPLASLTAVNAEARFTLIAARIRTIFHAS